MLQFGGLGDVVLMSELIGSLMAGRPELRVALACRKEFVPMVALFPAPPDEVIGLDVNPHVMHQPSEDLRRALDNLAQQFQGWNTRILIDGSLRPTWLTRFLAALLQPEISLCCGIPEGRETVLPTALKWFALEPRDLLELSLPPAIAERQRYDLLLDHLGIPRIATTPWSFTAQQEAEALGWLNSHGLAGGSYVLCFPGGDANVPIKRWPAGNFVRAIHSIRRQGHDVLLLGSSAEQEEIMGISRAIEGEPVPVFCGDSATLLLGMALISKAKAYLGNDTGPMHVAQVFGVPGVAIFGGGGQWPRYAPWAAGTVAMVHPLPCFGCEWDCFLGRGLCVESIPAETVTTVLLEILHGGSPDPIQTVQTVNPEHFPVLAEASARYRAMRHARAERFKTILDLAGPLRRLAAFFG